VDVVLSGTLMRSGDQLRVSAQLIEAPPARCAGRTRFQTPDSGPFGCRMRLTRQIVESLAGAAERPRA
jgi:TolB-like protein